VESRRILKWWLHRGFTVMRPMGHRDRDLHRDRRVEGEAWRGALAVAIVVPNPPG
jgi:hypothetical protein